MNNKKLKELYNKTSKHSHYQILAKSLDKVISNSDILTVSRYEKERFKYIEKYIDIKNKSLVDIGANTGFFSFSFIENGIKDSLIIEGNKEHCEFMNEAINILNWRNIATVENKYVLFDNNILHKSTDITLLLNVLHHVGDDYNSSRVKSIDKAKKEIIKSLKYLSYETEVLVFQLGFNWKGNIKFPLFSQGTKKELIDFIQKETQEYWSIDHIGIPEYTNTNKIIYKNLNENNLRRVDSLGEFLNRPLFIMKSLAKNS